MLLFILFFFFLNSCFSSRSPILVFVFLSTFAVAMLFCDRSYLYNYYNGNTSLFVCWNVVFSCHMEKKQNKKFVIFFRLLILSIKKWARQADRYLHQPIMSNLHMYILKLLFLVFRFISFYFVFPFFRIKNMGTEGGLQSPPTLKNCCAFLNYAFIVPNGHGRKIDISTNPQTPALFKKKKKSLYLKKK